MIKISKINSKNQVLIPVGVRKSLDLKPGDRVEFIQVASDRYELLAVNKIFIYCAADFRQTRRQLASMR